MLILILLVNHIHQMLVWRENRLYIHAFFTFSRYLKKMQAGLI